MDPIKTCILAKDLALSFLATDVKKISSTRYAVRST